MNRIAICSALLALAMPLSAADTSSQQNNQDRQSPLKHKISADQAKSCSVSKLLKANAKSRDGKDLGDVEDLLMNPTTGKIDFVVLGQGGVLGVGEDRIPVPWKAVTAQADGSLLINQDKAKFKSAPSVKKDYSNVDQPNYWVTVYEFYEIPADTGAAESPSGVGQGHSSSTTHTNSNK